jgi:hypothetical protein
MCIRQARDLRTFLETGGLVEGQVARQEIAEIRMCYRLKADGGL